MYLYFSFFRRQWPKFRYFKFLVLTDFFLGPFPLLVDWKKYLFPYKYLYLKNFSFQIKRKCWTNSTCKLKNKYIYLNKVYLGELDEAHMCLYLLKVKLWCYSSSKQEDLGQAQEGAQWGDQEAVAQVQVHVVLLCCWNKSLLIIKFTPDKVLWWIYLLFSSYQIPKE